jgi:hypothetical protein
MMNDTNIAWVLVYNIANDRSEWEPVKRGKATDAILAGSFPYNLTDEPDETRGFVRRDMYEKMVKA